MLDNSVLKVHNLLANFRLFKLILCYEVPLSYTYRSAYCGLYSAK